MSWQAKTMFDCRTCGACCASWVEQHTLVAVDANDAARLPERFADAVVRLGGRVVGLRVVQQVQPFRGQRPYVCVALEGEVMSRVACAVYDARPRACREALQPGDKLCKIMRARFA